MPLVLVASVDVEEEGLFGGSYPTHNVTVTNIASIHKLIPLIELGVRPTLFCAHSVFADPTACAELRRLKDSYPVEIAAHLHYWNTPPRNESGVLTRVPAGTLPDDLFLAKVRAVLDAARAVQDTPITSFRMGRWDIHKNHFPLLAKAGILNDASIRPLHGTRSALAPDHFDAPASPYWIPTSEGTLFEVPLTVTPLTEYLRPLLNHMPVCADWLKSTTNYWGALALLPVYHPLWFMKLVTCLSVARGCPLLSLTWHSSEMHPGATPQLPKEEDVRRLLNKISAYITWVTNNFAVTFLHVNAVRAALGARAPILRSQHGDWTVA